MSLAKTDQYGFENWEKFDKSEAYHCGLFYKFFDKTTEEESVECISVVVFYDYEEGCYGFDLLDTDEQLFYRSESIHESKESAQSCARAEALRSLMHVVRDDKRYEILGAWR